MRVVSGSSPLRILLVESPPAAALAIAALVSVLAYIVGSFPTGAIIARLYAHIDLTRLGSQRTGATNALRTMGLGAAVIVLLGDFAKGAIAVLIAERLSTDPLAWGLALFFAVVGHNRSIFLRGRGGRGVVTGLGGLAIIAWPIFLMAALSGCAVAAASRYVSLGSICGALVAIVASIVAAIIGALPALTAGYVLVTGALIVAAHADNIARLRSGTERRLWGEGRS